MCRHHHRALEQPTQHIPAIVSASKDRQLEYHPNVIWNNASVIVNTQAAPAPQCNVFKHLTKSVHNMCANTNHVAGAHSLYRSPGPKISKHWAVRLL